MAQSVGFTTFGVAIGVGDGASPEVFTNILEVSDIKLPSQDRGNVEFTHHTSPNDHRELKPGLRFSGTCQFTVNYLPADASHKNAGTGLLALASAAASAAIKNWQVTLSDAAATKWVFPAFVSKFDPSSMPVEGKGEAQIELTIASAATLP